MVADREIGASMHTKKSSRVSSRNKRAFGGFVVAALASMTGYFLATKWKEMTSFSSDDDAAGNRRQIVLVGDSLTQRGYDSKKGWVSKLASSYVRRADVINRGYSGYNTRWVLDLMKRKPKLFVKKPTLVVVFLGANDAAAARRGVGAGLATALILLAVLALVVAAIPRQLGSIFSADPKILDTFETVRLPLATTIFTMNAAVVGERVPMAMGRTRAILIVGLVGSWVGQVPAVLLCVNFWRRDLVGVYTGVSIGYGLVSALLFGLIFLTDFGKYAREAQERSEVVPASGGDDDAGDP